jgi:hypothetical protein
LIQSRCAQVAALIAGCDALAKWCGSLLDAGYRGEVECIIAKVFASEAVKHAAFNLALPTHGGRFFLQGHAAGDMAYDYLAPCIYEGENDLLLLAMFHALQRGLTASPVEQQHIFPATFFTVERQSQRLFVSRTISNLMITRVLDEFAADRTSETDRLAIQLLKLQLQHARVGIGHQLPDLELQLGGQLLERPSNLLQDAQPFVDPLGADRLKAAEVEDHFRFSPSPQPTPRNTAERE